MLLKYTPIDRIFYLISKIKPEGFNEIDVIDWTGEALEFMSVPRVFEQAICYTEVINHQCLIPKWTHNIIQIARDNQFKPKVTPGICPINIISDNELPPLMEVIPEENLICCNPTIPSCYQLPEGDNYPVIINQLGEPITEYELAYYRPYFDLKFDYLSWTNSSINRSRFSPVRLATNSFFNTVVCELENTSIYKTCTDEYTIIGGNVLRFSFEKGGVVISYERQKVDEKGIPFIPDHPSIIKAIEFYIRWQYALQDYDNNREGSATKEANYESKWHWYCKQAQNALYMPSTIDEWQNLLDQRNYLIPRNHYYGFFGHQARQESRRFLTNTNRR